VDAETTGRLVELIVAIGGVVTAVAVLIREIRRDPDEDDEEVVIKP
jgi:hypothetical protein